MTISKRLEKLTRELAKRETKAPRTTPRGRCLDSLSLDLRKAILASIRERLTLLDQVPQYRRATYPVLASELALSSEEREELISGLSAEQNDNKTDQPECHQGADQEQDMPHDTPHDE